MIGPFRHPAEPRSWGPGDEPRVTLYRGPMQSHRRYLHDCWKIVVPTDAGFTVERAGQRHRARPGQLIVLHPDQAHSGTPDRGTDGGLWILCVATDIFATIAGTTTRFADPVVTDTSLAERFRAAFRALERFGADERGATRLVGLVSALSRAVGAPPPQHNYLDLKATQLAREFLSDHLSRNVTLDELATVSGVDKFRLVHACTARWGVPPHALHVRLRIERAKRLIWRGHMFARIGTDTGFHDQAHFSRTFKGVCGMSPSEYRAAVHGDGVRTERAVPLDQVARNGRNNIQDA